MLIMFVVGLTGVLAAEIYHGVAAKPATEPVALPTSTSSKPAARQADPAAAVSAILAAAVFP